MSNVDEKMGECIPKDVAKDISTDKDEIEVNSVADPVAEMASQFDCNLD